VVDTVNRLRPDMVCLLGDYIDGVQSRDAGNISKGEFVFSQLGRLKAPRGVFAVLGNHDHWASGAVISDRLERQGIRVLNNDAQRPHEGLLLAGVDDYWEGPSRLERALRDFRKDDFVILMSHNPDINQLLIDSDPVDLVLSGHTHGGQVRIPFTQQALWVPCSSRYRGSTGLIRETEKRCTFVSKGVGTFLIPVRLNCPPDVGLVTLRTT